MSYQVAIAAEDWEALEAERDALKAEIRQYKDQASGMRREISRLEEKVWTLPTLEEMRALEHQLTELREAALAMRALGIPIHGSNQEYEELWAAAAKLDAVLAKLTPAPPPPCTCRFDRSDHGWVSKTPCRLHGQKGSP